MYRYYLTQRLPEPEAVPKHPGMIVEDYGEKKKIGTVRTEVGDYGVYAWGHVDYPQQIPRAEIKTFELLYLGKGRKN